jgi:transposase
LSQIEKVSIDLYQLYKSVAKELMPNAEIVADRFHVMKQVNKELDSKRREIRKEIEKEEEPEKKQKMLLAIKKSKYALLKNECELKESEKEKINTIKRDLPELGEMHELKEEFRQTFESSKDWFEGLLRLTDWLAKSSDLFPSTCGTIKR